MSFRRAQSKDEGPKDDALVEMLSWLMDGSIRVGRWSFGLDGVLGLIPGAGDLIGMAVSGIVIHRAIRAGLPKSAIARMVANVAVDTAVGLIPIGGDLFDFFYKSHAKNFAIFRQAATGQRDAKRDWMFVVAVILAFLAIASVPIIVLVMLVRWWHGS